jgi:hypothetical protein
MTLLVFLELGLSLLFVVGILMGKGDDLLLGTILGVQFLVLALVMICYMGTVLSPREVAEDRDEGLLW